MELEVYATQKIEGKDERERMKNFIEKWERVLNHLHDAMGKEAVENKWKIDGNYGGSHYSSNNRMMSSRIELNMML